MIVFSAYYLKFKDESSFRGSSSEGKFSWFRPDFYYWDGRNDFSSLVLTQDCSNIYFYVYVDRCCNFYCFITMSLLKKT